MTRQDHMIASAWLSRIAILWALLALGAALAIPMLSGCATVETIAPIERGGLDAAIVLDTDAGPVTIHLGSEVALSGEGASSVRVLSWRVIAWAANPDHEVDLDASGTPGDVCIRVTYTGALVISSDIPGTECPPIK